MLYMSPGGKREGTETPNCPRTGDRSVTQERCPDVKVDEVSWGIRQLDSERSRQMCTVTGEHLSPGWLSEHLLRHVARAAGSESCPHPVRTLDLLPAAPWTVIAKPAAAVGQRAGVVSPGVSSPPYSQFLIPIWLTQRRLSVKDGEHTKARIEGSKRQDLSQDGKEPRLKFAKQRTETGI
ncbi:hypothetical protein E5288_WYG018458 [Bos mutus]|uniref:Uncharacterized protein n=1 Tax=Bos mutus TaxID=72004 RepID=A0A6B0SHI1_9CETA|nr:hypothetical protein [Bos mutus]